MTCFSVTPQMPHCPAQGGFSFLPPTPILVLLLPWETLPEHHRHPFFPFTRAYLLYSAERSPHLGKFAWLCGHIAGKWQDLGLYHMT